MKIKALGDGRCVFDSGEVRGARIRRIFDNEAQAQAFMRKAKAIAKEDGERLLVEWLSFSANEIAELVRYRREVIELNGKPDWQKGRELHMAHLTASLTGGKLDNLLRDYLQRKRKAGRNGDYIARLEREVGMFVKAYPKLTAIEVTDKHVDSFLDKLDLGPVTRDNRLRDLSGLFAFAKKRNLCLVNPVDLTEPVKIVKKRIKTFSLQEVAVILWVADHHPEWELIPYLGLGLYGSARVCEAFRLDWREHNPEDHELILEAAATKTNQERVTENLPPVLVEWLNPYVRSEGPMAPSETTVEWRRSNFLIPAIRKILPDFEWVRNGLRKTSISADYAVTKDPKATAAKHGTSSEMLFANYRAVMRAATAAEYFQLTRAKIAPYVRGLVPDEELAAWTVKYQTPMEENPSSALPYAQHATATCCRKCLDYWHKIPLGKDLTPAQLDYATELVCRYIETRIPEMTEKGERISPIRNK